MYEIILEVLNLGIRIIGVGKNLPDRVVTNDEMSQVLQYWKILRVREVL